MLFSKLFYSAVLHYNIQYNLQYIDSRTLLASCNSHIFLVCNVANIKNILAQQSYHNPGSIDILLKH